MKIALISPYYPPEKGGGITAQVYDLSSILQKKGFDVEIFTTGKAPLIENNQKINIHRVEEKNNLKFPLSLFSALLKKHDFDLLHAHGIYHFSTHSSAFATNFLKKPLITTLHGQLPTEHDVNLGFAPLGYINEKFLIPKTLRLSKQIICSSSLQYEYLKSFNLFKNKIVNIPNFVDTAVFKKTKNKPENIFLDENRTILLYVGNVSVLKGIPSLFIAFKKVLVTNPDTLLVLVGGISNKDVTNLSNLMTKLDLKDSIKHIPYVDRKKLPYIYSAADIFVFSSVWDYFPMALLEAQSCSLPVVTTNVGAISEIVINEMTGFTILPGDSDHLAMNIVRLIEDKNLRKRMGKSARMHVLQNFDIRGQIDKIVTLYKKIIYNTANV